MSRLLVLGATGFLGRHLARRLADGGARLAVFRRRSSDLSVLAGIPIEDRVGAWEEPGALEEALSGQDGVFNLAACTSLADRDRAERERVNVGLPLRLVSALLAAGSKARLVHCSTAGTLGFGGPRPRDEASPFDAAHIHYFLTKRRAEEAVLDGVRRGLDAVIVNPATVFGPGMRWLQAEAFRRAAAGRLPFCPPGGSCFAFAPDVARGMAAALERGRRGERYILGGENLPFRAYYSRVAALGGSRAPRAAIPGALLPAAGWALERLGGRLCRDAGRLAAGFGYYSSEKAGRELGYSATPLDRALRETLERLP